MECHITSLLIVVEATLVLIMTWCCLATSHYLSQCWPRSTQQYGVIRPQWINSFRNLNITMFTFRETGNLFSLLLCSLWWVQIVGYVFGLQIVLVCLYSTPSHYRHCANLSGDIENACQIYFVECVSKIKHILSVIHYTICGAVCFQFTHFLCDDWGNIYTLSYYHHQIENMNYHPLFRVMSWNNGVRCMSFYIIYLYR